MVKQLGLPGMFETFSYADTHWDDLREILANYEPKLKEKDIPKEEQQDIMYEATQKYPHIVNSFFVEKFDHYYKEYLQKSLGINAYWITQEFQKRNAIHVHCLWWMDDQPDLMAAMREENKEKQLQMLQHALNWYSTQINAWNPLIAHSDDYQQFDLFHNGPIPQVNCKDNKIPRDLRTKYKPAKHPSKKRIYDFNDMES